MKIGIVSGSVREPRNSQQLAEWVLGQAQAHGSADYELIDLRAFDVPVLTSGTHPMMANKEYESSAVQEWSKAIDACDAYIFVTPEYNHGVPGALKNAVDSLGPEWVNKTVAHVGYGSVGGVRAIEQWRQVFGNFSAFSLRTEVNLSLFADFKDMKEFAPTDQNLEQVKTLIKDLEKALNA